MSEYIIKAADWAIDYNGESLYKGCEKIVRCRDCVATGGDIQSHIAWLSASFPMVHFLKWARTIFARGRSGRGPKMTDSKTATKLLRELLDERGVRWAGFWVKTMQATSFRHDDIGWTATEHPSGKLYITSTSITPEQTIAATLGGGECHDIEEEPKDFCCSECGTRLYIDTGDTYTMMAADERTIIKRPNYCPNCGAKVVKR